MSPEEAAPIMTYFTAASLERRSPERNPVRMYDGSETISRAR
jgi:hypothetical protein